MKKVVISFLITASAFFALIFTIVSFSLSQDDGFKVAMVTDFSDVNDASFNQACYEAGKQWCKDKDIKFSYYKPAGLSLAERVKSMKLAIDRGYDAILCPGFALGEAIAKVAPEHPEVKFIGIDIDKGDFGSFELTDNVAAYSYQEEIAGYLVGYGVVKNGFRKLGYLGGQAAPSVIKFGYGYIQGINAAASELKEQVEIQYVYGGQFFGDSDIYKYIDNWYKQFDTEIIFACGGSIYTSVALAAKENNGYMIGVDIDQAPIIDRNYAPGICITSAMKGIKQTVMNKLEGIYRDHWEHGVFKLGLESYEDPTQNYIQLPIEDWRMDHFSVDDYKVLIKQIMDGEKEVSDQYEVFPTVSSYVTVYERGQIK